MVLKEFLNDQRFSRSNLPQRSTCEDPDNSILIIQSNSKVVQKNSGLRRELRAHFTQRIDDMPPYMR